MTKVILSPLILEYRQMMADLVNQVCEKITITGVDLQSTKEFSPARTDVLELCLPGLLSPPRIELLSPDIFLKKGCLDGIIQIFTSEYFGVLNVYVSLEDDRGNHIESGYATSADTVVNYWGHIPSARVPAGTTVIVRANVVDRLGGVGIQSESITV